MTMRNATLRQLKVFETVARHLSFSRAAEELHLTQPAVSTQVRQLEEHAGLPLFEQLGKKIYLTPAGTEMIHYSRAIMQQFHEVDEAMSQLKGVSGGKLNVAVISAGDYFFPRLLAEFTRRYSGVVLNLAVHNREELLHQLATNQTDLAVMVRPPHEIDSINEPFAPHPYVIVAAPSHPLANKRNIKLSQLANEAFVVRERGSDTWDSMGERFCRPAREPQDRDGDQEHRDDQAGGDRRHGDRVSVRSHDQPRTAGREPRCARRGKLSGNAQLVRRPSQEQAPAAGRGGLQALPDGGRREPDRADHASEGIDRL